MLAAVVATFVIVAALVVRLVAGIDLAVRSRPHRPCRAGGPRTLTWELDPDFHRASSSLIRRIYAEPVIILLIQPVILYNLNPWERAAPASAVSRLLS